MKRSAEKAYESKEVKGINYQLKLKFCSESIVPTLTFVGRGALLLSA